MKEDWPIRSSKYRDITAQINDHVVSALIDTDAYEEHWNGVYLNSQSSDYSSRAAYGYLGLAHGVSGAALALLVHNKGRDDDRITKAIHAYLIKGANALADLNRQPYSPGVMSGLAGFGYALATANVLTGGYSQALLSIDDMLAKSVQSIAGWLNRPSTKVWPALFDQVGGLSGIIPYLIARDNPTCREALAIGVSALANRLCGGVGTEKGYLIAAGNQPSSRHAERFPSGYLDLGLAHGIAGVLSALSISELSGNASPHARWAIERLATTLIQSSSWTHPKSGWPDMVSPRTVSGEETVANARAAWCYGAPGVIVALHLSWRAVQLEEARNTALEGLRQLANLPIEEMGILAPTFCHGAAGVLQITNQIASNENEAIIPVIAPLRQRLENYIVGCFDPTSYCGFSDWVEVERGKFGHAPRAGLLDGAAGIWLTLFQGQAYEWTRPLLIS